MSKDPMLQEEGRTLANLWNAQSVEQQNSATPHSVHPAPAVEHLLCKLLAHPGGPLDILRLTVPDEGSIDERLVDIVYVMVTYGDALFRFGQYCALRGLLYSNLTACKCSNVSVDDINRLLEQKEGS